MHQILLTAADTNPAGGAAVWEAILASVLAVALTLGVAALGWAHRTGRVKFLGAAADRASKLTGLPPWAGLPSMITGVSLIVAVIGMYWDISLHIAEGRDPGPFANPAHFLILFGLFGIFVAGFCAVVLPEGRPSPTALRLGEDWYAPLGGIGLLGASAFALAGFPLDDFWHRIFGQDVTLWGPTHLMMIGGASLAFIGQATLLSEALLTERKPDSGGLRGRIEEVLQRLRMPALMGGFLIGLSTFQGEFDFGVPQFRMLFAPVLIAMAAGIGLVAARIYGGRGMAIYAALFFIALRGGLALLVGPVFGEPTPHFPLYLAEALLVEGAALLIVPTVRPYAFGALAGAAIGTIGFAAEYAYSHVWTVIPWQPSLIGEALLPATLIAIGGGLLGAFIASSWRAPIETEARAPLSGKPALAGLAVIVLVVGFGLQTNTEKGTTATVDLTPAGGSGKEVNATVKIDPPSAAEDTNWLNATSWQGGGLHVNPLEAVDADAGVYRTSAPMPVYGSWKSLIRIQRGDSLVGTPVFLPEDTAIPAAEVPASPHFTRPFIEDKQILQREQAGGVPGWVTAAGYGVVGLIVAGIMVLLGWILARLGSVHGESEDRTPRRKARSGLRLSRPAGGSA
jgi:hypothetical protein